MGKAARVAARKQRDVPRQLAEAFRQAGVERPAPATGPRVVDVEPGYPEDWRMRLGASADRMRKERARQELIVAQAVAAGASWSAVAKQLGVSRQAAFQRFRHVVGEVKRPA